MPKGSLNLGGTFLDFDSTERCRVVDLDSRYDLVLGMAWDEINDLWIDWRCKILGTTRDVTTESLESHEPTFARQQHNFWCEPLMVDDNVLYIGTSEFINSNVHDMNSKRSVLTVIDISETYSID